MEFILVLALGYILGMCTKGFHVTIERKKPENSKQEYNESTVNQLPEEVRLYAEQNNGFIRT